MAMRQFFMLLIISGLVCFNAYSQTENTSEGNPLQNGTIQEQYDYLMKKSTTYQEFKVIRITSFEIFKTNIDDSLKHAYKKIETTAMQLSAQNKEIRQLNSELSTLKTTLETTIKEKDSLTFLGMMLTKASYKAMMWGLVVILLFFAVMAYVLFKRSNLITKATKKELEEVKTEFEEHRKRALTREQELAVKYHSELNKLKSR